MTFRRIHRRAIKAAEQDRDAYWLTVLAAKDVAHGELTGRKTTSGFADERWQAIYNRAREQG